MRKSYKIPMILFAILTITIIAFVLVFNFIYTPRVVNELKTDPQGTRAEIVMLLQFPDGTEFPVNYMREGNLIYAGCDTTWWKMIAEEGTQLNILIKGESLPVTATVSSDEEFTYEVFSRLRPTMPEWISRAIGSKLVIFEVTEQSATTAPSPTN